MFIKDFSKPLNSSLLNETMAKKFGQRVNLERYTLEQLMDARNKIRTKLANVETNESFESVHSASYRKEKLLLDILNTAINERQSNIQETLDLTEGKASEAELIMAAQDMVDKITSWMEDTAEMQAQSMLELADAIRDEMGSEISEKFSGMTSPELENIYKSMEQARKTLVNAVGLLTGDNKGGEPLGEPDEKMPDDELGMDTDLDIDTDTDMEDDFGTSPAADGGSEMAGRPRRESVEKYKKKV